MVCMLFVSGNNSHTVVRGLCLPGRFFDYGNCARARYTTELNEAEIYANCGCNCPSTNKRNQIGKLLVSFISNLQ